MLKTFEEVIEFFIKERISFFRNIVVWTGVSLLLLFILSFARVKLENYGTVSSVIFENLLIWAPRQISLLFFALVAYIFVLIIPGFVITTYIIKKNCFFLERLIYAVLIGSMLLTYLMIVMGPFGIVTSPLIWAFVISWTVLLIVKRRYSIVISEWKAFVAEIWENQLFYALLVVILLLNLLPSLVLHLTNPWALNDDHFLFLVEPAERVVMSGFYSPLDAAPSNYLNNTSVFPLGVAVLAMITLIVSTFFTRVLCVEVAGVSGIILSLFLPLTVFTTGRKLRDIKIGVIASAFFLFTQVNNRIMDARSTCFVYIFVMSLLLSFVAYERSKEKNSVFLIMGGLSLGAIIITHLTTGVLSLILLLVMYLFGFINKSYHYMKVFSWCSLIGWVCALPYLSWIFVLGTGTHGGSLFLPIVFISSVILIFLALSIIGHLAEIWRPLDKFKKYRYPTSFFIVIYLLIIISRVLATPFIEPFYYGDLLFILNAYVFLEIFGFITIIMALFSERKDFYHMLTLTTLPAVFMAQMLPAIIPQPLFITILNLNPNWHYLLSPIYRNIIAKSYEYFLPVFLCFFSAEFIVKLYNFVDNINIFQFVLLFLSKFNIKKIHVALFVFFVFLIMPNPFVPNVRSRFDSYEKHLSQYWYPRFLWAYKGFWPSVGHTQWTYLSPEEEEVGNWFRENTPVMSRFVFYTEYDSVTGTWIRGEGYYVYLRISLVSGRAHALISKHEIWTLYETDNSTLRLKILQKGNGSYIVVGPYERGIFQGCENRFERDPMLTIGFKNDNFTVFCLKEV
ncbi:MAG: hypothetical protein ACFFCD_05830 [Promethearchaeota archaeon]